MAALACGLPLIGDRSDHAAHLVAGNQDALPSRPDDVARFYDKRVTLFDRAPLRDLAERAARDGAQFTPEAVVRHRSDLMKPYGA
jgi:hypothetical protein